jgi:hypothetical protein
MIEIFDIKKYISFSFTANCTFPNVTAVGPFVTNGLSHAKKR